MNNINLMLGNCLERMRELPDNSVDSIVTDPPYGLSFMGKKWDYDVPSTEIWAECLRVLKPGGHLLAFAGTRTQHRMAVRIEDAGFEIRDMIAWVYGSGFPKSLDVSKAIDKAAGAEREFVPVGNAVKRMIPGADQNETGSWIKDNGREYQPGTSTPATEAAQQWQGWGTALKPALEPITVARKPLIGTVAENVLTHGTGAINVDGCRVEGGARPLVTSDRRLENNTYGEGLSGSKSEGKTSLGRWPANLIHDGSQMVLDLFPEAKGAVSNGSKGVTGLVGSNTFAIHPREQKPGRGDTGSAARFFYCAKTSKRDRDEGLTNDPQTFVQFQTGNGASGKPSSLSEGRDTQYRNNHPTVKPTDLMRYLCRLVTQPGGTVLDPFMGSGSTGKAAIREGFGFIGVELDNNYFEIAKKRIEGAWE